MATKPTDRILNWANAGTTTDPGAGKENQGWNVDDRPPANWWNWILNSFGKWLSYAEDVTDEILLLTPISILNVDTGQGAPSISSYRGQTATPTLLSSGLGDSGGTLRLTYSPTISIESFAQVTIQDNGSPGDVTAFPVIVGNTSNYVEICIFDDTGTIIDLDDVTTFVVHVVIWD